MMLEDMAAIARKGFVRAVPGQRHGDMGARQLAHAIGRQGRCVGEGLVEMGRQRVDQRIVIG